MNLFTVPVLSKITFTYKNCWFK